jgi:hypothetical protein
MPKQIDKKIDEEVEEVLIAPKMNTAVDVDGDTFSVVVDTAGDITVYLNNDEGYILPTEEVERLMSKLAWALEAQSALTDRTPF